MRRIHNPDAALWAAVTATVRPLRRVLEREAAAPAEGIAAPPTISKEWRQAAPRSAGGRVHHPAQAIEPGRRRRLERGSDGLNGRVDLHGHGQDSARELLTRFILGRYAGGARSVLVITGKGALGEGVLRRRVPEWLGQPPLRAIVAGLSEAHGRHGGEGALYVALRRR